MGLEGCDRLSSGFPALSAEKFDLFDRLRGIGKILMMGLGGFDPQLQNSPKFLEGVFDRFSLGKTAFAWEKDDRVGML